MLIAEDEYETEQTLPEFAARHLSHHFSVQAAYGGKDPHEPILGVGQLSDADAVLISVRRRALPEEDLRLIREFVASGKPVIGIRTASHAFSLRKDSEVEPGRAVWPDFDQQVFGGNYTNHYGNGLKSSLNSVVHSQEHPILRALNGSLPTPAGSLYKAAPLESGTQVLVEGSVAGEAPQPTAWTFIRTDGGRSFYTSLGHPGDFQQAEFEALLSAGIHWACGLQPPALAEVGAQNNRYLSGGGKQRK
jgi:type 1 glutamine amidotransferase